MLILTRRTGETLVILADGKRIVVGLHEVVTPNRVRLSVQAPSDVVIARAEKEQEILDKRSKDDSED